MALINKLTALGDAIRTKTGGTTTLTLDQMVTEISGISTGVELNFNVVGGTTQPANPAENTIWVNTDMDITGWYFDANQPENMTEGEVWISVGDSSEAPFNTLKKNNVTVYPISAQQMVSGELITMTAKSYQNGEWATWWNGELYYLGEKSPKYTDSLSTSGGVVYTEYDEYFNIRSNANGGGSITIKNVDLTRFSKLYVCIFSVARNYGNNKNNATASFGIRNSSGTVASVAIADGNDSYQSSSPKILDISNLKGLHDLCFSTYVYTTSGLYVSFHVNQLYLEV